MLFLKLLLLEIKIKKLIFFRVVWIFFKYYNIFLNWYFIGIIYDDIFGVEWGI